MCRVTDLRCFPCSHSSRTLAELTLTLTLLQSREFARSLAGYQEPARGQLQRRSSISSAREYYWHDTQLVSKREA